MVASSVAVVAALALAGAADGAGSGAAKGADAVIELKSNNRGPKFKAPPSIVQGGTLEIVHEDPQFAAHTFSIMKRKAIPQGEEERSRCGHFHGVCKDIRLAHGLPRHDFVAEVDDVENGNPGWDKGWSEEVAGDSSYLPEQGDVESRTVSTGKARLWFMCSIYPKMQGSIEVVQP